MSEPQMRRTPEQVAANQFRVGPNGPWEFYPNRRGVGVDTLQRRVEYGGRKGRRAARRLEAMYTQGNSSYLTDRDVLLSCRGLVRHRGWIVRKDVS